MLRLESFLRWFSGLTLALFLVAAVMRGSVNPAGAHGHRQMDTLGMSLAWALDFRREGLSAVASSLLHPRILQRSLSSGVNASEFPLLNFLTFPGFILAGPHGGAFLATLFVLLVNVLAATRFLPRLFRSLGHEIPDWQAWIAYLAVASVEFQLAIAMPEGLAFPLLIAGLALLLESRLLAAVIALALAVAVKPTAVVGFLVLAAAWPAMDRARRARGLLVLGAALLFPAWWYAVHAGELRALGGGGPQIFAPARLAPLERLAEVGAWGSLRLVARQIHEWQFPIFTGWLWVALALVHAQAALVAFLAGLIGVILMDGAHLWNHAYYFFGAGAISLVVIARILARTLEKQRAVHLLCLALLLWGGVYGVRNQIWVFARTAPEAWWRQADQVRALLEPDADLVTDDRDLCPTKLFFAGRTGTIAQELSTICRGEGFRARKINFLVDHDTWLAHAADRGSCLAQSRLLGEVRSAFARWRVLSWGPALTSVQPVAASSEPSKSSEGRSSSRRN